MQRRTVLLVSLAAVAALAAGVAAWLWFLPEASRPASEALPDAFRGAAVVAKGAFRDGDSFHQVAGTATLLRGDAGALLRVENYSATDGPDVYLYLTRGGMPRSTEEVEAMGVRLHVPGGDGGRATLRGAFNVPVPSSFDPAEARAVAVWCDRFNVLFGGAELSAP